MYAIRSYYGHQQMNRAPIMKPPEVDWKKINQIIENYKGTKWGLIPLLQEVQEHTGYIPPESIEPIAEAMNLFPAEVQGVITFYRNNFV